MKLFALSIFSLFLVLQGFKPADPVIKKADKAMAKYYDTKGLRKEFITIPQEINQEVPSDFSEGTFFKIYADQEHLGYGFIGNAPSKTADFDYLVLFTPDLIIAKSKVLIYREEYGGEISSKRWLKQFDGKNAQSGELRYNQEIIPISGATISVRSMTKAVNELLGSLKYLQQNKVL
ncbi:MAG: FMN-binding protein [Gilvibacter sp.]